MYTIGFITLIIVTQVSQFTFVHCKNIDEQRSGRWYNAYTKTVLQTRIVTSTIPSSCIQVDPTLLPCRNVRYMNFPQIFAHPQYTANGIAEEKAEPLIPEHSTTALSWGEYLGIYAPTLTVTKLVLETTTVKDARVMVTYAIRGCKPVKLPLDLMVCPQEDTNAFSIQDIIPTSTVSMASSTLPPDFEKTNELIADNEEPLNEDQSATPTEALPF